MKKYFFLFLIPLLSCQGPTSIRFGVVTDVHKDIVWDADQRLQTFIDSMNFQSPDFIIQMGDFCRPYDYNSGFMDIWNSFKGDRYHVLGNHDMDGGFSRDSTVVFFQSADRYYSFDFEKFHFIVLDGNDINPSPDKAPGYAHFIGEEQQNWLRKDLSQTKKETFIFSHQPLNSGLENSRAILEILQQSNERNNSTVIACFNGHDHADQVLKVDGIWFIQINSMSYDWLGEAYQHQSYKPEIHQEFPFVMYTAPYLEPLWAMVEISPKSTILIKGRKTIWVGRSPSELGHPGKGKGLEFRTRISDTILFWK